MKHLLLRLNARLDDVLAFDRTRNSDGEFAPQTEGGPDPNAMARVYGAPEARLTGPAAAAVVGGAGVLTVATLLGRSCAGGCEWFK